jgi:hypothetical protein
MRRAVVLAFALLPIGSEADEVFIQGGGRLSGEIVERGPESIVVDIGSGQIGLALSLVERIVPGTSPVTTYRQRAVRLAPNDVAGWLALGEWARAHDLLSQAREAFEHVVSLEPRHPVAHRALGHVLVDNEWMTVEEGYRARGYVRFDGTWVTPEERRAILDERMAAREAERAAAEAEARIREAEARARVAEAEAQRAEVDLYRAEREAAAVPDFWLFDPRLTLWFPPFFDGAPCPFGPTVPTDVWSLRSTTVNSSRWRGSMFAGRSVGLGHPGLPLRSVRLGRASSR